MGADVDDERLYVLSAEQGVSTMDMIWLRVVGPFESSCGFGEIENGGSCWIKAESETEGDRGTL